LYHDVHAANTGTPGVNENGTTILCTVSGYVGFDANEGYSSGFSVGVRIVERNLKTATLKRTVVALYPC
jgi:hypothetical protein